MTLCVCGHPGSEHLQHDQGDWCRAGCFCQEYRKAEGSNSPSASLSAGVTPEGLAGATVSESVNEAAERLRQAIVSLGAASSSWNELLVAALDTERRNTVDQIRAALQPRKDRIGGDPAYNLSELVAILDEVAS